MCVRPSVSAHTPDNFTQAAWEKFASKIKPEITSCKTHLTDRQELQDYVVCVTVNAAQDWFSHVSEEEICSSLSGGFACPRERPPVSSWSHLLPAGDPEMILSVTWMTSPSSDRPLIYFLGERGGEERRAEEEEGWSGPQPTS